MYLKLYGIISQIYEPGTFAKCTPIFIKPIKKGTPTEFYRIDDTGKITEVDLSQYDKPIFLPASRKKINDGKEYFIIYRSFQNSTQARHKTYRPDFIAITTDGSEYWMPRSLSIGIKFPDKFVCVLAPDIDANTLENMCC